MNKVKKGEYGYIEFKRKSQLVITMIFFILIAVILYTGYGIFNNKKNILTVFAAVLAIPTAKYAVTYIILIPRKSITRDEYDKLETIYGINKSFDYVVTSQDKIFCVPCLAVKDNSMYLYMNTEKVKEKYVVDYLNTMVGKEFKINTIKVFKDYSVFFNEVRKLSGNMPGKNDEKIIEELKNISV